MQRIVDEILRRARFATQFVATACLLALVSACGTEHGVPPTAPRAVSEPTTGPLQQFDLSQIFDPYVFSPFTNDDANANDAPEQSDLNTFSRADNVTGKLAVAWTWDDINSWTGSGQTGDACALFDTDAPGAPGNGGGNADFALCVRITNPNGDPNQIDQLPQPSSPVLYQCSDKKTDRCTTTFTIVQSAGGAWCEVVKTAEAFPNAGDDGFDILAACEIPLSAIGNPSRTSLLNVCSFPSGSPNSNPFDCVVTPGSGFLQIKKVTVPDKSNASFGFTLSPAAEDDGTSYTINPSISETTALIPVDPTKTYSITESTGPQGWALTNASCSGGTSTANPITGITIGVGETKVCTFTNTQSGSITIVKDAISNDQQDFVFSGNITGCTSFTLDDDAGATGANDTYSNQKVCPVTAGTYNVDETVPANWVKTSATCSDGSPITAIELSAGENVTCTFTNTKNGSITIVKDAIPNDQQNFVFTGTITGCTSFTLDDDAGATGADDTYSNEKVCAVAPGTYNVDETVPVNWAKTGATCSDGSAITAIAVSAGENITCTFTNTKNGSIKIVKDAVPDHAQDFSFTPSGFADNTPFSLDDDANGTLPNFKLYSGLLPGSPRTVSESAIVGWSISDISCTGATSGTVTIGATGGFNAGDNSVTINLAAGDNVVCTFMNTAVAPGVEVTKTASPTSIPETGGNVTYTVEVTNTASGAVSLTTLTDDKFGDLDGVGSCVVPQSLAAGAKYTCSFQKALASAEAGDTHVNTVTATVMNAGGSASDGDDATVTYTNVNPSISVSKTANPTSISTAATGTLTFPNPDRTFDASDTPGDAPSFASPTCDDGGPNDQNAQVDLNCFNRADNVSGKLGVRWTWDDINSWSGTGSTGDACALIDSDNDGKANVAVCARISNAADGSIFQVGGAGSADVYVCNDTKSDRCAKQVTTLTLAEKKTTTCSISQVADGFGGLGDDGADVRAECSIDLSMQGIVGGSGIDLLNVCSFPSGEPNSNPFDCVVGAGVGFIQITKVASPTTSQYFGFTLSPASTDLSSRYKVQGGATTALIPVVPGNNYVITETLPTEWSLSNIVCMVDGGSTGTKNLAQFKITGIEVKTGQTTLCTFTNTGLISGSVEYTIRVTNLGKEDVSLVSLIDDKFGDLNGVGTCVKGGTITGSVAGNLYYECKFTKTISGAPGTSHTNEVTAVAEDNETPANQDTKKASATVNIVSPP